MSIKNQVYQNLRSLSINSYKSYILTRKSNPALAEVELCDSLYWSNGAEEIENMSRAEFTRLYHMDIQFRSTVAEILSAFQSEVETAISNYVVVETPAAYQMSLL